MRSGCQMIEFFRWFYCELCESPAIKCNYCENTSCNGGGCDKCNDDFNEVTQLINDGLAPDKDTIPYKLNNNLDLYFKKANDVQ